MHRVIAAGTCVYTSISFVNSEYILTIDKTDRSKHSSSSSRPQTADLHKHICMQEEEEEDGQPTARTLDRRVEVKREACLMTT